MCRVRSVELGKASKHTGGVGASYGAKPSGGAKKK